MPKSPKFTLLFVDDEPQVLRSLKRLFYPPDFLVFTAASGKEALEILSQEVICVIICDMRMPKMNGVEFFTQAQKDSPNSIRIMLTGQSDMENTIDLINHGGIFKYITKPWDNTDITDVIHQACLLYAKNQNKRLEIQSTQAKNDELTRSNSKLQKSIYEQTTRLEKTNHQLANAYEGEKKLRHAKNEAQRLNEAKSQFLATMSHEIRSPLNAIITMNALLLESELNTEQRELVKIAHTGGQSLLALINDILDFSKIDAGKLKLNEHWFNLIETIEDVAEFMACQTINKPIEIITIITPNVPNSVFGDQTRIRQILINIISNAIKFTERGGIQIRIDHKDKLIHVSVDDSGIGISKENQEKIFSEFVQVDHGQTRSYGGTGLGLSICRQLIHVMGGEISVSDNEYKGSKFYFYLPLQFKSHLDFPPETNYPKHIVCLDTPNSLLFSGIKEQLSYFGCDTYLPSHLPTNFDHVKNYTYLVDITNEKHDNAYYKDQLHAYLSPNNPSLIDKPWEIVGLISNDGIEKLRKLKQKGFTYLLRKPPRLKTLLNSVNIIDTKERTLADKEACQSQAQFSRQETSLAQEMSHITQNILHILLVEDSLANQAVIKAILKKKAHIIDIANNGKEAVDKAETKKYDIILMDISMPIMDGFSATKNIRSHDGPNQKTTIIAMTANAFAEDKENCLLAGMSDFISKPIDVHHFLNRLIYWTQQIDDRPKPTNDAQTTPKSNDTHTKNTTSKNTTTKSTRIKTRETPVTTSELISQETVRQLAKDTSWEALPSIIGIYFNETQKRVSDIQHAFDTQNWKVITLEAHTLKSSSATFGALKLSILAREFEEAIKNNSQHKIDQDVKELNTTFNASKLALNDFIHKSIQSL